MLYEPTQNELKNIDSYIKDVDILYVIDNSKNNNSEKIPKESKVRYIFNNDNIGVSKALNMGAKKAIQEGCSWLLTMDQDTKLKDNTIPRMKKAIEENDISKIGIITPWHSTKLKIERPKQNIDYPLEVMTSGNLVNLKIYEEIGGYKDWMFIDGIDIEYGLNLNKHGYKIMRLNDIEIEHNLGDIQYKNFLWEKDILCTNHNYIRRYYMMRNYLYIRDMYKEDYKDYVDKIANQKRNIAIIILFEKDKYKKIRNTIRGYIDYKKRYKGKIQLLKLKYENHIQRSIESMRRIKELIMKSIETLKMEGIKGFYIKAIYFIKGKIIKDKTKIYKDILFINGCTLPHPQRYRVDHQIEQLESAGLSCSRVNYDKIDKNDIKFYRGFIFFRCPITSEVKEFIQIAKSENKTVFFDIDDLVIDQKYTDTIKYLKTMSKSELDLYNDGVNRTRETLQMCDYAITTTERLAAELKNYVKDVYINRNVASEKMTELSLKAMKDVKKDKDKVIMSYLSGSITHNDDFKLIMPVIQRLMKENENLYLKVVGLLDIPEELQEFKSRILTAPFVSWMELPKIIASIDINLAPLEKSIFNEAKSENKWVEAALCKVVTVASDFGAFKTCITDGVDGILCDTQEDWYNKLNKVIKDSEYRAKIAENAFKYVIKNKVTTYTGLGLYNFIESKLNKNIAFVLPSTNISGGVNVAIKHCKILKKAGYDAFFINMDNNDQDVITKDGIIRVIKFKNMTFSAHIHTMVATLWSTLQFVKEYPNVLNRSYLVQNFETDFFENGNYLKIMANATYNSYVPINYLTISKWCQNWLKNDYNKECKYAPNGINMEQFPFKERKFEGKIKILVEGNSADYYKNVDESFKIVEGLDKSKYEISYLSYQGKPKSWYYVDNFMYKVPFDEVGKVYSSCDILIKSSILESFSYPPLEMMATGGIVVVAPNEGNVEYLQDEYNCLFYEQGNIEQAVNQINRIVEDKELRNKLISNGLETVKNREWSKIEKDIVNLYQ